MIDYNHVVPMCPECSCQVIEIDDYPFEPFFECPECGQYFYYDQVEYVDPDGD